MRMVRAAACKTVTLAMMTFAWCAQGQATAGTAPTLVTAPEKLNLQELTAQGRQLLEKAKAGDGTATVTLANYKNHYTILTVRNVSGGGEMHAKYADFIFLLDGDCTEMTGGTMIAAKEQSPGEVRGTRLEGATAHTLHAGDIFHVPAGTPHQVIVPAGKSIVMYVIKFQEQ